MADRLTPQQKQAVTDRGGKLLVSAAAGSGKTKVLVDRLMMYLTDPMQAANLDDFLIITYTKAAASELRGKIASKLTERIAEEPENRHLQKQMQRLFMTKISTVHGFCSDLLREYAYKLDIPADFRVGDENECQEIRETVLSELLDHAYAEEHQNTDFHSFIDTQGLGRDDRLVPELILKVYDSAKCHLDPNGWLDSCIPDSSAWKWDDISDTIWGNYLISDLHTYLDDQLLVMRKCVKLAEESGGLEKPAAILRDTLIQMENLRRCTTWDEIVLKKGIDYGRLTFPKKNVDLDLVEQIKAARNACKKGLDKKLQAFADLSEQSAKDLVQCASGIRGLVELVRRFEQAYANAKKSRRILDFGDLEHKTLDLLTGKTRSGSTAASREIGRRYREIMVDEYQDSNGVQDAIFTALTEEKQNCFMVGDVKQSIYQFRLADPGIFLKKYYNYVSAEAAGAGQGRKVFLSHNFRSGPEIISAVNDVFSGCMTPRVGGLSYGKNEALREGIPHIHLPDAAVEFHALEVREDTYAEEAAYVAERISQILNGSTMIRSETGLKPVGPEDIVILLRSPGSIARPFQKALEARGIPCRSTGGNNLLETEEIGTLCSFLQVIVNPRQDIPLISTLASPIFGFTADDLAQVRNRNKTDCFYDALLESNIPKAEDFLRVLLELRREARRKPLTQLLEHCLAETRLDSLYGAMADGDARRSNIQTFFQLAVDFEKGSLRDLSQFLQHLDTLQERGLVSAESGSSGSITIMSIHKSKGLEFPVVFLCGLSRSFNRESLHAQILCDKELKLGLSVADSEKRIRYPSVAKRAIMVKSASESLSEEMRVLYVAMTRPRDRLIMTYAVKNLEKDIQDVALRMDFDSGSLLCQDVVCPGEWVLLAAMRRMEAAQLHSLGGRPKELQTSDHPWKICVSEASDTSAAENITTAAAEDRIPAEAEALLARELSFHYPYIAAVTAPSKQTATDRTGRRKDAEAAEQTREPRQFVRNWRVPAFADTRIDGRFYGNAIHAAMQYLRYENCIGLQEVNQEIHRLSEEGFLSNEQAALVDCEKIAAFFQTELGKKLSSGVPCLREFKFSILDDGTNYDTHLVNEKVLLQGVVDCAILEQDGITIIDFKTDRVTEKTLPAAAERYRIQLETYGDALERIYELPIKAKFLYFFQINKFWKI